MGTGVAAMAGGGTCEIRNLMDSLRTDLQGLPSWVFLLSATGHSYMGEFTTWAVYPNRVLLAEDSIIKFILLTKH